MDVLSLRGYPLGAWIPGGRRAVWRAAIPFIRIYPQATKMTVVKTVSIAIFEPSFFSRHFQDLDAGEFPGELTPFHRDAPL